MVALMAVVKEKPLVALLVDYWAVLLDKLWAAS
jgi:hypothetical protein